MNGLNVGLKGTCINIADTRIAYKACSPDLDRDHMRRKCGDWRGGQNLE